MNSVSLRTVARRRVGDVRIQSRMTGTVSAIATVTVITATESGTTKSGARARIVDTMITRRMAIARPETAAASGTRRTTVARRSARRRGRRRRSVTTHTGPRGITATMSAMIGDANGMGLGATLTSSRLRTLHTSLRLRRSGRTGSGARLCTGMMLARSATARCSKRGHWMSVQRRCEHKTGVDCLYVNLCCSDPGSASLRRSPRKSSPSKSHLCGLRHRKKGKFRRKSADIRDVMDQFARSRCDQIEYGTCSNS